MCLFYPVKRRRITKALELFDRESLIEIDLLYKGSAFVTTVQQAIKRLLIFRHGMDCNIQEQLPNV